jgi:hypothetical protein
MVCRVAERQTASSKTCRTVRETAGERRTLPTDLIEKAVLYRTRIHPLAVTSMM